MSRKKSRVCLLKNRNSSERPVLGVGAVIFKDDCVLLVKRKFPPAQNTWAIPGGKVRFGETLQQAAEREIFEETGVLIKAGEAIYVFELIEESDGGDPHSHYVIIDLDGHYVQGEPLAADDALETRWVSRNDLKDLPVNDSTRRLLIEKYNFNP